MFKLNKSYHQTYAYDYLVAIGNFLQDFVLLIFRLYWGYALQAAGWAKFLNINATADFFTSLQIPLPEFSAHLVATVEFLGGWFLIIGLASRLVSIPLIIIMIVALISAYDTTISSILMDPSAFTVKSPVTYLIVCCIIFSFGPGRISLDFLLEKLYFHKEKSNS